MIGITAVILLVLIFLVPIFLLNGWIVMLCLGALSHIFGFTAIAIGFWPSVVVGIIIFILIGK